MITKKIGVGCAVLVSVLGLTACHQRVEPVSNMDRQLTCSQLQHEIQKVENVKSEIASNRGVSGRNALGLLFWPSIVVNEVTGESAEKEATNRIVELKNIYASKQCARADVESNVQKG